jgi:large subunit ribosomal protein L3
MSGHMGDERVTVQNLAVYSADVAKNIILIEGAVPGSKNSLVIIRKSS